MPARNPLRNPCWLGRALCFPLMENGDIQETATMGMGSSQIILELPHLATGRDRDWARRTHQTHDDKTENTDINTEEKKAVLKRLRSNFWKFKLLC